MATDGVSSLSWNSLVSSRKAGDGEVGEGCHITCLESQSTLGLDFSPGHRLPQLGAQESPGSHVACQVIATVPCCALRTPSRQAPRLVAILSSLRLEGGIGLGCCF